MFLHVCVTSTYNFGDLNYISTKHYYNTHCHILHMDNVYETWQAFLSDKYDQHQYYMFSKSDHVRRLKNTNKYGDLYILFITWKTVFASSIFQNSPRMWKKWAYQTFVNTSHVCTQSHAQNLYLDIMSAIHFTVAWNKCSLSQKKYLLKTATYYAEKISR